VSYTWHDVFLAAVLILLQASTMKLRPGLFGLLGLMVTGWLLLPGHLLGQTRLTPELMWQLGRLDGGVLSGDGKQIAYVVRRYDLAQNSGSAAIHVLTLDGQQDSVLVSGLKVVSSLQWVRKPEGDRLFYIGQMADQPDAKPQVFALDPAGGTPQQVTNVAAGVANLKVSPTADRLAFTVDVKLDSTVNELYPDLPLADARIIDSLMYRHWNAWHDYSYSHLHVAPLNADGTAGAEVDLMRGLRTDCPLPPFGGEEQFAWSPDGRQIALTMKLVNNSAESTDSDIYLVNIDSPDEKECITHGMNGYDTEPVYSPDGNWIAFHSMQRPSFEADRNRIMLFERAGGTIRELTQGLDQTAHAARWTADSRGLIFVSETQGTDQIFRLRLDVPGAEQLTRGWYDWRYCGATPDGQSLLAAQQSMLRPEELAVVSATDASFQVVTHINDAIYQQLELPRIEQRWTRATDGKLIHSWVLFPPDFDGQKSWPMLTYCQGGPQGQVGQWFSYRWNFHLMAANGYVVLAPNRRGLPGFGQAWNDQISGDWAGQAMQDLLAATDEMLAQPYIDRRRVGAVGASFGGFTTYWLMGNHQDRFRCLVAHCGVFNLESMYGSTEELFFVNHDLGGPYWKSAAVRRDYERFSPHRFVGNWKTPLLVIHGEKDFRVPVTQGLEAFTAAQVQGVPSRFLYFPNEGHWVLAPQNSVLWHRVFYDWLDGYLK
jgi:dipeptidyl aminopeptidase/acylaminoacyl peptidase